jgi:hypothetical protein
MSAPSAWGTPIAIYEGNFPGKARWQIGVDAAVFAIFDLDAPSSDLVNADYWLGLPLSYRKNSFSTMLRLYHQSSHLGDEFLLRNRVDRVNVSYEGVDLRLSYDLFKKIVRLYAGGGYILRREPDDLERLSAQGGVEDPFPLGIPREAFPAGGGSRYPKPGGIRLEPRPVGAGGPAVRE